MDFIATNTLFVEWFLKRSIVWQIVRNDAVDGCASRPKSGEWYLVNCENILVELTMQAITGQYGTISYSVAEHPRGRLAPCVGPIRIHRNDHFSGVSHAFIN